MPFAIEPSAQPKGRTTVMLFPSVPSAVPLAQMVMEIHAAG